MVLWYGLRGVCGSFPLLHKVFSMRSPQTEMHTTAVPNPISLFALAAKKLRAEHAAQLHALTHILCMHSLWIHAYISPNSPLSGKLPFLSS